MKKGIIALALAFGFNFAIGQDTSGVLLQCERLDGQAQIEEQDTDDFARGEDFEATEQQNFESEGMNQSGEFETETEIKSEEKTDCPNHLKSDNSMQLEGESRIEDSNANTDADLNYEGSDIETETEFETNENIDANSDMYMEPGASIQTYDQPNAYAEANVEVEDNESTLENIVEAPFKFTGEVLSESAEGVGHIVGAPIKGGAKAIKGIAKGAFTVVSEVGEGAAHIVTSPIKGVAKLFGSDNDENMSATATASAGDEVEVETDVE